MPCPNCFTPGKGIQYPLHLRLGGLQVQSGWLQKISPSLGLDPWIVAHSKLLYWLCNRELLINKVHLLNCSCYIRTIPHITKKKKKRERENWNRTTSNIANPTASCSLFNRNEYMQIFPSSSHGSKVAVIIVNSQHCVRQQSEVNW